MHPLIDIDAITESVYDGAVYRSLLYDMSARPGTHVVRVAMASAEPGCGGRPHFHPATDETYYIIAGTARLEMGDGEYTLNSPSCIQIPRGTVHRIVNAGGEPLRYLAFHTSNGEFTGAVDHIAAD